MYSSKVAHNIICNFSPVCESIIAEYAEEHMMCLVTAEEWKILLMTLMQDGIYLTVLEP